MAHYKILGQDPYWMNFYGLMILTLIEVLAVGADLDSFAESLGTEEKVITLWILTIIAIPKFIMIAAVRREHPHQSSAPTGGLNTDAVQY